MAAVSTGFSLTDVSCLDGTLLVNGNVYTSKDPLFKDKWQINDLLSFTLTQTEGMYKILDFNSKFFVFAKMDGVPCSPLTRGSVTHLIKTEWKETIKQVDCAICNSSIKRDHEKHEVPIPGHGVYITPSNWTFGHELSLKVDSAIGKRYLCDQTNEDVIVLP